jgi:hypothetical protein
VHDGRDESSERIQAAVPLVAAVLQGIHARSPEARVLFVNYAPIGHDACQPPVIRWVEPVVPVNAAAPIHPNLGGMLGASNLLVAALQP